MGFTKIIEVGRQLTPERRYTDEDVLALTDDELAVLEELADDFFAEQVHEYIVARLEGGGRFTLRRDRNGKAYITLTLQVAGRASHGKKSFALNLTDPSFAVRDTVPTPGKTAQRKGGPRTSLQQVERRVVILEDEVFDE